MRVPPLSRAHLAVLLAFDLNPPMILRHRGEIRLHMWVRNGPKETIIVRRGRTARPAGAPVMRKLERSQQSNGTRAAEAQRAHLTSSNLLSAASICVGGAFRCCTRGTGIESLAATRTTEPSLRNPEPTMGFEKVDGQRMVTLTDTPLCCQGRVLGSPTSVLVFLVLCSGFGFGWGFRKKKMN